MTTISSHRTDLLLFVSIAAVASFLWAKKQKEKTLHSKSGRILSPEEQYVADSIRVNMPPARRMGITVEQVILRSEDTAVDEGSVSLSMPIKGNTNVHGTAFAGSLYSLCVLSAWYTLVIHLRNPLGDNSLDNATVVVKSSEIQYKKPLWNIEDNQMIVATSFLASGEEAWKGFLKQLHEKGKTTCGINGEIRIKTTNNNSDSDALSNSRETVVAVEFKATLCVMLPPTK